MTWIIFSKSTQVVYYKVALILNFLTMEIVTPAIIENDNSLRVTKINISFFHEPSFIIQIYNIFF